MPSEKVTREEYAAAVASLVDLACTPTSGGRAAAEVLLSAYNGFDFQVDIAGLGSLDSKNHALAMTVIRGRYDTGWEPHSLIKNGGKVFQELWRIWYRLHVEERGKFECPECDGRGKIYLNPDGDEDLRSRPCSRCGGKGRVCRCGR